jgi:hypothetical protein
MNLQFIPNDGQAITASDSTVLSKPLHGFMVAADGDVTVRFAGGGADNFLFPACKAGSQYAGFIDKIYATGTTATGIVGLRL